MHGSSLFTELSLVIAISAALAALMRALKQPLILGYILAGLLVGPAALNLIHSTETFQAFSSIGIALLLFIIGLGMSAGELKRLGKVVIITALATLLSVGLAGFAVAEIFHFTRTEAIIIGLSLFFSSTIIIIKILSDKKEQNRLHGQIAIGIILVDDIVATFALLFLAASKNGSLSALDIGVLVGKGVLLLGFLALASSKILPKISRYMASSQEMLFLFAIAWGFGIATLSQKIGFSIEVGALFAGVSLASSPYAQEIGARLKPLRDFFIVLFFLTLGESMKFDNLTSAILPALILSAIVIIGKPMVVTTCMRLMSYAKRVSFKAGVNLSQISEFSIILVVLAASTGAVRPEISAIITLVAIITIATSAYMMQYDDELFAYFDRFVRIKFINQEIKHPEKRRGTRYQYLLFGYHHGGHSFITTFQKLGKKFLAIDYDPNVIDILEHQHIPHMYGDATDRELLEEVGVDGVKLIVSTFTDYEATSLMIKNIMSLNSKAIIICHAANHKEALQLYELGASYVMILHQIGSEKISSFILGSGLQKSAFEKYRNKHLKSLHRIGNIVMEVTSS